MGEPEPFGSIPRPRSSTRIPVEASCCSNGREMPEFGSAGSWPGPALLSPGLPARGDNWRESFSWIGCLLTCFLSGSRTSLDVSGSWGRSGPPHRCGLWWGGGNPKTFSFLWQGHGGTDPHPPAISIPSLHSPLRPPLRSRGSRVAIPAALPFPGCSPALPEPIPPSRPHYRDHRN